jgi:hypothetical protein
MSSLGNLAAHFEQSVEELSPLIQTLESKNRLRLSLSRCQSDCSACHSCDPDSPVTSLSEKMIVISLEQMKGFG